MANKTISGITTEATEINGADWLEIEQGGASKKVSRTTLGYSLSRTVTGNTTFTDTDETIFVNTTTATITLPLATAVGRPVVIEKVGATEGLVSVARAGSDTIGYPETPVIELYEQGDRVALIVSKSGKWSVESYFSARGGNILTTPPGVLANYWTSRTSAADNDWHSISWSPELGLFAAVAYTGTGDRVMTSPDGINWTSRTSAADNNWRSISWSPELGLFAAVAYTGTGDRVMTSARI